MKYEAGESEGVETGKDLGQARSSIRRSCAMASKQHADHSSSLTSLG
jgi:hypothetical protein